MLAHALEYAALIAVTPFAVYLLVRVSTLAVLQSISQFRRRNP